MASPSEIAWEDCLVPPRKDREVERAFRQKFGAVPPSAPYFANSPWVAYSFADANYRAAQLVDLDLELADLIFLAVSQDNSCRFCYAAQRSLLRILGFDETRIRRAEEAASSAETEPGEKAALDFARRFSRANPAPGAADREQLRGAGFSEVAIKEVAHVAAYTVFANRATTLPAVPTQSVEALPDRFAVKLLRPLIARFLLSRIRKGQPESLPTELRSVPFAQVPLALDGLPTARIEAGFLKRCFESGPLPRRTKALVFAVIARGLGSELVEHEAKRLCAEEGLLADQVDEVLAHLASPALDPIESAIVPFARETIRVRPIEIQRRARKLLETLDAEQFVDLVGVIGLANATGRLSLFLCEA